MEIKTLEVAGIDSAIKGMRYPYKSSDRSDSHDGKIGPADLELAFKLISAGTEHRKFLRQIQVWMEIDAPRYWWTEFDTYKVGTVSQSESTMHTILKKEFTVDDFEAEQTELIDTIRRLNSYRRLWQAAKADNDRLKMDKYWSRIIKLLPQSYKQKRVVSFNYETALSILRQREGHKLKEWQLLGCELLQLPYMTKFWKAINK